MAQAREKCKGHRILISSGNYRTCESILRDLRTASIEGADVQTADEYVFTRHADEILRVFDWLEDDLSKDTYVDILFARMHLQEQRQELVRRNQYFGVPEFTVRNENEVYVDCGAYVGDTIEQYLMEKEGVFGEIYAFEPDRRNFAAMEARVERIEREWAIAPNRIHLERMGVGARSENLSISNSSEDTASLSARFTNGDGLETDDMVPVVALDEYFGDRRVGFLKADIESFEYPMLLGAGKLIRRDVPKIAICIYHNPSDMYRIAWELKRLVPEYRLAIRQHYGVITDTVLYAWA